mmetsp:Transcript_2276/g.5693  ORF Transcript_2276/g.5693 Transcript_2276/m.5693 type:complete len:248 (-) Transcript_2276:2272-3015(-)
MVQYAPSRSGAAPGLAPYVVDPGQLEAEVRLAVQVQRHARRPGSRERDAGGGRGGEDHERQQDVERRVGRVNDELHGGARRASVAQRDDVGDAVDGVGEQAQRVDDEEEAGEVLVLRADTVGDVLRGRHPRRAVLLARVDAQLEHVVQQQQCRHVRQRRREQRHVAVLHRHLEPLVHRVEVLPELHLPLHRRQRQRGRGAPTQRRRRVRVARAATRSRMLPRMRAGRVLPLRRRCDPPPHRAARDEH